MLVSGRVCDLRVFLWEARLKYLWQTTTYASINWFKHVEHAVASIRQVKMVVPWRRLVSDHCKVPPRENQSQTWNWRMWYSTHILLGLVDMHRSMYFLVYNVSSRLSLSICLKFWYFTIGVAWDFHEILKSYKWKKAGTPSKINIEPENDGLEDDFPLPVGPYSQVFQPLIFRGVFTMSA